MRFRLFRGQRQNKSPVTIFAKVPEIFPPGDGGTQRSGPQPQFSQHGEENEAAAAATAAPPQHCHTHIKI